MGWAGHKLTDNGAVKGESERQSLGNGTCPSEPASLWRQLVELEDDKDILEHLKDAGGKVEGLEEVDNKVEVLEDDWETLLQASLC